MTTSLHPSFEEVATPQAHSHCSIAPHASGNSCRSTPYSHVGNRLPLSPAEQYAADLEVIERCERQIEEQGGCPDFFGCMGELSRRRA